jgi:glycosyltransferase involved in cell wall biosynthesis
MTFDSSGPGKTGPENLTFDIMLPYYGDVALMQAAVHSVIGQSDQNWRLTVVDDGQEPGVPEWFAQLGDDRVRYQRNEHNLGVTRNYQKCISLVEFEYLVMMGTDDLMLPNYVANLRSILTQYPGVAMVQPGVEVIDGSGKVITTLADQVKQRLYFPKVKTSTVMGGEELAASLLRGCWFYFPSICWRTDAIRKVNLREDLTVIQDLAMVIDLLRLGEQMAIDTDLCFQYRRHAVSVSAARALTGTRFTEARNYFVEVSEQLEEVGWHRAARAARLHLSSRLHACTLLPGAVLSGNGTGVRNMARHAFGPSRRSS